MGCYGEGRVWQRGVWSGLSVSRSPSLWFHRAASLLLILYIGVPSKISGIEGFCCLKEVGNHCHKLLKCPQIPTFWFPYCVSLTVFHTWKKCKNLLSKPRVYVFNLGNMVAITICHESKVSWKVLDICTPNTDFPFCWWDWGKDSAFGV